MRTRVRTNLPTGLDLPLDALERFNLVLLLCDECYRPMTEATDAFLVWRADRAWNNDGDTPAVVHADCRDRLLRSRFLYEQRHPIRMAPLADLLGPLVSALGSLSFPR